MFIHAVNCSSLSEASVVRATHGMYSIPHNKGNTQHDIALIFFLDSADKGLHSVFVTSATNLPFYCYDAYKSWVQQLSCSTRAKKLNSESRSFY